jgi:alpha/beta superfamily hydrolase
LKLGCETPGAAKLIAVGFPANSYGDQGLGECPVPRHFIVSKNDQFCAVSAMETYFSALPEPKELIWIEAQDHFFTGKLDEFEEAVYRAGAR